MYGRAQRTHYTPTKKLNSIYQQMNDDYLTDAAIEALKRYSLDSECIKRWENEKARYRRRRRLRIAITSAAAAVAMLAGLSAWLFFSRQQPDLPAPDSSAILYRSADNGIPEIDSMITSGQYSSALDRVNQLCDRYDSDINAFKAVESPTEEQAYEQALTEEIVYNLGWRKINLLIALDRDDEALPLIREYRFKIGPHQKDAHELWRKLN